VTQEEALQRCGDPIARRGIRALYRLAQAKTQFELSGIQAEVVRLGLDGMKAVHFLEHCLKEASNG